MKSLITSFILLSCTMSWITAKGCYPGFHRHGNSCYWFSQDTGSFREARSICEHMGSHLAVITNSSEDAFIRGYVLGRARGDVYYLGASDLGLEGSWRWEGGKPLKYTNWGRGQPDNFLGIEHCLSLWNKVGYKWNDLSCKIKANFICEEELVMVFTKQLTLINQSKP